MPLRSRLTGNLTRLVGNTQQPGTGLIGLLVGSSQPKIGKWASQSFAITAKKRHTYCFLVLAQGSVDDTHVEQNLGGVGNLLEVPQCLVEFIVVIPRKGGDPGFYFLIWENGCQYCKCGRRTGRRSGCSELRGRHTPVSTT